MSCGRQRAVAKLVRCYSGATAVEFALIAPALIATVLFISLIGTIIYSNQALDYATNRASRQIMVGAAQSAGMSQSAFQSLVCSYLSAAFTCANVIVNVQTVAEGAQPSGYYAFVNSNQTHLTIPALSNASAQYSLGIQGSYQYVQVVYPITFIPSMFASILGGATYKGSSAYLVVSTAAFRNEQY